MSASVQTRSGGLRGARPKSLFYRDLGASPATHALSAGDDVGGPNQAAAARWRDNVGGGVDPLPPPFYTLEDRIATSPESTTDLSFRSPDPKLKEKNASFNTTVHSPPSGRDGPGLPSGENEGLPVTQQRRLSGASSWWSPLRERGTDNREGGNRDVGSPVSALVQQPQSGGLRSLSAPREIIRPGLLAGSATDKGIKGEEWVTVFGFGVDETNSVLREFEKCGPIVNHVSGPGGANWVHIQYQNYYDAQIALQKNGLQLNGALILGVKMVDPVQLQALTERVNWDGPSFMALPPETLARGTATAVQPSIWSQNMQPTEVRGPTPSVIASPSKSTLSKLVDLMFSI